MPRVAVLFECATTWRPRHSARARSRPGAGRVDEGLCREIKDAVHSLESIQVADLMALLGRVKGITAARH